jgi:hypothetical protein
MPRGGRRRGAGRKKGAITKRSRAVADDIVESGRTPLSYMLRIMEDVTADPIRRDEMARAAAPFVHPKLSSITTSNVNFKGGDDIRITQILAVPRGGRIDQSGTITIDGELVSELPSVEPYEGTPPLSAITDQTQPAPLEPPQPLPVVEVDTANVTRLDQFKTRRDEDEHGGPGVA